MLTPRGFLKEKKKADCHIDINEKNIKDQTNTLINAPELSKLHFNFKPKSNKE